ncbi:MAG: hypothetical protein K2L13_03385 [Opitutales bacterium]|nr:hypothetical protein [Opitutales bacterium]
MLRNHRFFYGVPLTMPIAAQPDQEAGDNPKNDRYSDVTQSTKSTIKKSAKNVYINRQQRFDMERNTSTVVSAGNIPTIITSTGIIPIAGIIATLASMRRFIWSMLKFSKIIGCKRKSEEEQSEQDINIGYYIKPRKKHTKV